jgi:alcohol-forming fatty acyl-CoA reductase
VASVKFNEKLKDAINTNILYTKRIVHLTKQMKNLKSFMHVSTFYSQCHLEYIPEKIDVPSINCDQLLEMTNGLSTEDVEKMCNYLKQDMPNTYTLTKRYAEELVSKEANFLPAGIFRPPILCSTYKEPMPGWTDNLYGPMGFAVGTAKGFIHSVQFDENKSVNALPIDYCINAVLATAWDVSCNNKNRIGPIPVYNYLYAENNLSWKEHLALVPRGFHEPLNQPLWHFSTINCSNHYLYLITFFILHTVPGFILDCLRVLSGQEKL